MLVRVTYLSVVELGIPKVSIRGYDPFFDYVGVDHRRFARSYRNWRKSAKCDFYNKRSERLARFRAA
jgi:hypothetical protein